MSTAAGEWPSVCRRDGGCSCWSVSSAVARRARCEAKAELEKAERPKGKKEEEETEKAEMAKADREKAEKEKAEKAEKEKSEKEKAARKQAEKAEKANARGLGLDAVWPGWGHASESLKLPATLKEMGITFIGPTPSVMSALGDKIAANILAQTAEVPSIPWSGDGLEVELTAEGTIPEETFTKAIVNIVEEAQERAAKIGYPVSTGKKIAPGTPPSELLDLMTKQVTNEVLRQPTIKQKIMDQVRDVYESGPLRQIKSMVRRSDQDAMKAEEEMKGKAEGEKAEDGLASPAVGEG